MGLYNLASKSSGRHLVGILASGSAISLEPDPVSLTALVRPDE
jgi:hypothetical protein